MTRQALRMFTVTEYAQGFFIIKMKDLHSKRFGNKNSTTHGESKTRLYYVWNSMKARCFTESHKSYANYGGRGITVCAEWKNSFEAFRDWAMANGYNADAKRGECTLDRIDVNGDYCPENCRWISQKEQCNNKGNNHEIAYNGKTQTLQQWCSELGLKYNTVSERLRSGWGIAEALHK